MNILKFFIVLICSFLIVSVGAGAGQKEDPDTFEYEKNLLLNGDFEQGLRYPWGTGQYSNDRPIWWNSSTCTSRAEIDTKSFRSGAASLFIDNPSSRAPHVFGTTAQRIDISPERRYRLVLWAGARELASPGAVSFAVDRKWQVRPVALPSGSFPWTRFEGMFTLSEGQSAEVRVISEDRGKVWIDDIEVIPDLDLSIQGTQGRAWSGREGDGWDFVLSQPRSLAKDRIAYRYTAQHMRSGRMRKGEMHVTVFGRHLKAELMDPQGRIRRGYDGTLSEDGSLAWGSCWPRPESSPGGPKRYGWWATIENIPSVVAPATLSLNRASVAQLEAVGLSGRSARTLVEGRVLGRSYRSLEEALGAPGLMQQERNRVEARCIVQ